MPLVPSAILGVEKFLAVDPLEVVSASLPVVPVVRCALLFV